MTTSVIVAGARTPVGKLMGSLKDFSGSDLGAVAIRGALEKAGVPIVGTKPEAIDLAEDRGEFGEVLRRAGLTTGAAYRLWADQNDYQRDLAVAMVRLRLSSPADYARVAVDKLIAEPTDATLRAPPGAGRGARNDRARPRNHPCHARVFRALLAPPQ